MMTNNINVVNNVENLRSTSSGNFAEAKNQSYSMSSMASSNELNDELRKFRKEHFKNNEIYQKQERQAFMGKDTNKVHNHLHFVKNDSNAVDVNNNDEVASLCEERSCNETGESSVENGKSSSLEQMNPFHKIAYPMKENNSQQPSLKSSRYDFGEDFVHEDQFYEDNNSYSDDDEARINDGDTQPIKFTNESDEEDNRNARVKAFRDTFGEDILRGFTNFDLDSKGSKRITTIKVPDIDKFHRNIETDYEPYPSKLVPNKGMIQVDGSFDTDERMLGSRLPQVDGYNDANMNDLEKGESDINNNQMLFKEPYSNASAVGNSKRGTETRPADEGKNDSKFSRQDNYDNLWYNKFTLGRKEMSTVLRVKNVLCKQSDSTVFLVQATEWPGGRMVDNTPSANQIKKKTQPSYKIDVDQMEQEFGTDLKEELKNGRISSNLLALKVAKKKGTKKNSAQIYKEMAKELRFLRTFRNVDHHGFIVKIYAAFQTRQDLCVLTEFVPGGDLHTVASVSQIGIPETVAKFYMSEILCALGYIHKQQLVLRDLKLENVMVDLTGHVKLIDFGLAADLPGEVMLEPQRVGTRSYFPPEIDANQPYCESVDWWCFGVTMYDLLHQEVPIKEDENGNKVYDVNNIKYAERLSKQSVDLMKKLLVVDQFKRLENAEMVRFHPFFEPYSNDWRVVEDRKIRPPWVPGNKCLTSNLFPKCFDPFFTRQKLQVRPDPKFDEGEWGNGNYHYFQEFKYIGDIE